jgi:ubiquinone/menaquinone biosynthesis C-methylase UbiE/uncharacterized protein YbaR (Trm112 family)
MKPYLLKYLVCPIDKQPLKVVSFSSDLVPIRQEAAEIINRWQLSVDDFNTEIIDGVLLNERRRIMYPVFKGVPRLLIFDHSLQQIFKDEFARELKIYSNQGYEFPNNNSVPGEENVLKSFSTEWTDYGFSEDAYWGQTAEVYNNSLFATLRNENQNLEGGLVLEVGIGSGGSANDMSKKFKCNLIGMDLGYSVDVAFKNFSMNPFFHIVQASAFHLPFRNHSFDFVYSHGVIHHTFNTKIAFKNLSTLPKSNGRLYVWVYSFLNETRTAKRKIIMILERLVRPWCAELPSWLQTIVLQPIVPLYILHQNAVYKGQKGMARYSWREALHAARDRFTPKYIHRHSEEEVMSWFAEHNFTDIRPLSQKSLPDYVPEGFYMNTGVEGFKN